jgi:LacI family transcriptional regulator
LFGKEERLAPVTINDVAALAGVSLKTVSRVVNGEAHVRPQTREKVLGAIARLDYQPNFAARALAGARSYLIGVYCDNPSPAYIAEIQLGAMRMCRAAGHHLVIDRVDSARAAEARAQVELLWKTVKVDGVVLSPPVCDCPEVLEALEHFGIPYVRIAPAVGLDRGPYVHMDDRLAAFEMTGHLLGLGHRRIGFVRGPAEHSATHLRHQGFLDAMGQAGVAVQPGLVQRGAFSFRSGVGAAEQLLGLPAPPTAIFASNDDMALGVMAVASRKGLSIPGDLSVAGFDDAPVAEVVWPQLTTVRQPVAEMAAAAVKMLLHRDRAAVGAGEMLAFELVVRGSTGPAGAPRTPASRAALS